MLIDVKWLTESDNLTNDTLLYIENGKPTFKNKNELGIGSSYTHPATHPASMITQDANHRFVTDDEKSSWASNIVLFNDIGVDYTLLTSDSNRLLRTTSTSPITITIPNDSTLNFPIGTQICILRYNTGDVTIVGASGVSTRYPVGNKMNARYSTASMIKLSSNEWLLLGDLIA